MMACQADFVYKQSIILAVFLNIRILSKKEISNENGRCTTNLYRYLGIIDLVVTPLNQLISKCEPYKRITMNFNVFNVISSLYLNIVR